MQEYKKTAQADQDLLRIISPRARKERADRKILQN